MDRLRSYREAVLAVPAEPAPEDLLINRFRLYADEILAFYYAPLGGVQDSARVILLGITPGWSQMRAAFMAARQALREGEDEWTALRRVKQVAAFRGPMRRNLIAMFDDLGVADVLEIGSTAQLFDSHHHLVHTTSVLKYPVFVNGQNYTGHRPKIHAHGELVRLARTTLTPQLTALPHALVVPLGRAVESALELLDDAGQLGHRWLRGFPHPSGANGHRLRQFRERRETLRERVQEWRRAELAR